MTAAITWAVLATGIGLIACALSEYQRRWKEWWTERAEEALALANEVIDQLDRAEADVGMWKAMWDAADSALAARVAAQSAHMREIGIRGNKSLKRKAAVQRLQVVGKAAEINREMGR